MNKKKIIFFAAWIGVLVVLVVVINKMNDIVAPPPPPKFVPPTITDARWKEVMARTVSAPKGDPKAPFSIVEFGDFCCPQCGAMHEMFANLPKTAPVSLYFINRPFPKLKEHENAVFAAQAGMAAAAQGKFWPMFETLYDHQKDLQPANYEKYANQAGLNGAALSKDVQTGKYMAKVQDSLKYCDSIGMTMTPAIICRNNKTGEYKVAAGRDDIDKLLQNPPWTASAEGPATVAKGQ
jgi:protein-disulfide isomerase